MVVDGVPNVRTCITPLREGMKSKPRRGEERFPPAKTLEATVRDTPLLIVGGGPAGFALPLRPQGSAWM
jgi:sarcosine oxidase subunit alpha